MLGGDGACSQVDGKGLERFGLDALPQPFDVGLRDFGAEQTSFSGAAAEYVGEAGGEYGPETVVPQCPDCMFAGGSGAEVGSGDQDAAPVERCGVEGEVGFSANTVQLVNKDGALRWLGGLWMVLVVCAFGGPFEDFAFDDAGV